MISVDIPMPENCRVCPLMYDDFRCNVSDEGFYEKDFDIYEEDLRPDWCPLIDSAPHVMKLSDIHNHMALWIEERPQEEITLCIGGASAGEWKYFITEYDASIWRRDDVYGKTWRAWTAKPTAEQRKAVKWDDK